MTEPEPCVSVVTATYNRSNVLRFAVESVLAQTLEDWELWVIGDACTDDTAEVMAGFDDPRVRFVNLARNVGEQSGPNNEGFRRSRGRYVAYLNHDDLWFPDHLERCVTELECSGADLVWPLAAKLGTGGAFTLSGGASSSGGFKPSLSVPASLWVFRRELGERVGPWRYFRECHGAPSQNWLFRAWKRKAELGHLPWLTVVTIPATHRRDSYLERQEEEHRVVWEGMRSDSSFRERLLTSLVARASVFQAELPFWPLLRRSLSRWLSGRGRKTQRPDARRPFRKAWRNLFDRLVTMLGLHPQSIHNLLRYGGKGRMIDDLRRRKGLPPVDPRE